METFEKGISLMKPYIRGLYNKKDDIEHKIRKYQNVICKHLSVDRKPKANTGNWDQCDDRYWMECRCQDCDKFWIEEQ
jgi:hypothetical protein